MVEGKRRLDRVLDAGYLDGVSERDTSDVRAMRAEVQEEESLFSYERRLLHGRLAILRRELERRAGDATSSIIEDLPSILADEGPARSRGSFPGQDPNITFDQPSRRVSKLLEDDSLSRLNELTDDEIRARIETLTDAEREISTTRRSLLGVLDALNAEIARRYRSGEADPSDALTGR